MGQGNPTKPERNGSPRRPLVMQAHDNTDGLLWKVQSAMPAPKETGFDFPPEHPFFNGCSRPAANQG